MTSEPSNRGNQMLLVTLSTVVMLAKGKQVDTKFYQCTRKFLHLIRDENGKIPPNIAGLLKEINDFEKNSGIEDDLQDDGEDWEPEAAVEIEDDDDEENLEDEVEPEGFADDDEDQILNHMPNVPSSTQNPVRPDKSVNKSQENS